MDDAERRIVTCGVVWTMMSWINTKLKLKKEVVSFDCFLIVFDAFTSITCCGANIILLVTVSVANCS